SMDHGKGAITGTQQNYGQNKFFPLLSNTKIFINTKYTNQNKRDSFLWRAKTNSLFSSPRKEMDYYNSVIIGSSNKLGYTFEAIFTTFIFNENPFLNFTFFQYEIYFSSFSILTGVILLYVDGIIDKLTFKWNWISLSLHPILTTISLSYWLTK
ncbi:MAG: hypothetical protein KAS71_12515, partial [Bacteroidales bacterium]|nr:hypothetical protein [Bacteroidales bacterium]